MAPLRPSRYAWWPLCVVDGISLALTAPLTHGISLATACYTLTTHDDVSTGMLFLRFAVIGPCLFIFSLLAFLPGVVGWLLWVALNTYAAHLIQPFRYHAPVQPDSQPRENTTSHPTHPRKDKLCHSEGQPDSQTPTGQPVYQSTSQPDSQPVGRGVRGRPFQVTVSSANVLLCPEAVSRFNNCPHTSWRLREISSRLLRQDSRLNALHNLKPPVQREKVVVSQFPEVDVLLLQEVLERWAGQGMVAALKEKYPYCVYDVGVHSKRTNMFLCGSGLFLASKFPVLDCAFHPYTYYSHYGCLVGLGVLLAKLDLGAVVRGGREVRAVGYVANTHTQAYQGEKRIVCRQLAEASAVFERYVSGTLDPHTEALMFAVLGGDFNSDNMSVADRETQNLALWDQYTDPCRAGPGQDEAWTVGTEFRQKQLSHPAVRHSSTFRDVLLDDVLRRHFILDADVEVHTLELIRVRPRPGGDGQVRAVPEGGRRRIDHLLLRKGGPMRPVNYWFSSAIAGLTDHIPVAMMLQEEEEEEEEVAKVVRGEEKEKKEEEMRKEDAAEESKKVV